MLITWQSRNSKDIAATKISQISKRLILSVQIILWVILRKVTWENYNLMSVSEEEKRGKIIILVIGYEQSSTRTKILSVSNAFPNASLTSCLALEPISSLRFKCQRRNWLWSSSSLLKYWQSSQKTTASPLASKVAESPCFAAGSTQDIMQKTEAACPQGKGKGLLLPGDYFR